jgi:hypothetical protein
MPVEQVRLSEAVTKAEVHQRFRDWLQNTDEHIIGPTTIDQRTAWIHVQDGDSRFRLHADANRPAIAEYMRLVVTHGDNIKWHIVANQKGNMNTVAFGPQQEHLSNTLYLYLIESA